MAGALSRRNLFKIGGGVAAAGVGVSLPTQALAQEVGATATWQSELVRIGTDGKLNYFEEEVSRKKIPNFSWAGYRNGEKPIPGSALNVPEVPVVVRISPVAGDNTAHLQAALDEVGAMDIQENGFRGALLLAPGVYEVAKTVFMEKTGVVLRGSSRSADPAVGTIIRSTAKAGTEVDGGVECPLWVGGKGGPKDSPEDLGWVKRVEGTATDVVADVPAGSRRLTLASVDKFKVGDNIIIWHRCSQDWLDAIDGGGGVAWEESSLPILYNRYIKEIHPERNEIVICAPVFNDLDLSLSQSFVYVWGQAGQVHDVGVENLRVDMGDPAATSEEHADSCIAVVRTQDSWVRNVSTLHFKHAGVIVRRSTRVTVDNVTAHHPRSRIEGKRRYSFNAGYMAQQVLFKNLETSEARHAFVSGGQATSSGNVWVDCVARYGHAESGGHAKWSQGLLFDNVKELFSQSQTPTDPPEPVPWILNLHNRETAGEDDKQGWSSVYSVLWNCTVGNGRTACVQQPPTSQNFAIGTNGIANGVNWYDGNPTGYIEGNNVPGLEPVSLYRAQVEDRLGINFIDL